MRCIFATLGFEEKFAVRTFTRHGLDRGDAVCILRGPPNERADRALGYVSDFIARYYGGEVRLSVVEVPVHSMGDAVYVARRALEENSRGASEVVVNLSGGMRALVVAVLIALSIASLPVKPLVELELEDSSGVVEVPWELLRAPLIAEKLTRERVDLLRAIVERGEVEVGALARQLGRDESTVRRQLKGLGGLGLVKARSIRPLRVACPEWVKALCEP